MPEKHNGNQPETPPSAEFSLLKRAERVRRLEAQLRAEGKGHIVDLLNGGPVRIGWVQETNSQTDNDNVVGAEGLEPPTLSV